ncbi:MAG: hypothetical protein IVW57_07985 [Ktedonobacterales bacterium]|nr:hypothetical protein [Ktedonobacterales bacterium]
MRESIRWRLETGKSVTRDGTTVTPLTRVMLLRWPGGALVRLRPAAVLVQRGGGRRQVPVVDVTRVAQLAIIGVGIGIGVARLARHRR